MIKLGDCLRKLKKFDEAQFSYKEALKIDSKHADSLSGIGLIIF
jgi:cytochrome c-type biogenesis protein CcmH/NrfG